MATNTIAPANMGPRFLIFPIS